jgi:hypothetical protein
MSPALAASVPAMTSWLIEGYAPGSASMAEVKTRARDAAAELTLAGTHIRYLRTIFVREDETCFHVFEAASAETVREAAERAGLSAYRIVEAETEGAQSD